MSNEQTHDTQEPTGARLTEAQVAQVEAQADLLAALSWTCDRYSPEIEEVPYPLEPLGKVVFTFLTPQPQATSNALLSLFKQGVFALLADRAARVAEVARLQHAYDMNETTMNMQDRALKVQHADLASTLAQNAELRPLVEQVAAGDPYMMAFNGATYCRHCNRDRDYPHLASCFWLQARALVATLAAGQTPAAPDTAATAANRQHYPHFSLVWTVIDAVAAGDNERARAYADLLADHLDADYPYEAKRIRNRLSPDYDPGPLLYLMAEMPAAPTPDGQEGGEG